mmetsp:Transcript_9431/g.38180  ORF Transcript_9431/g.38180 Transcript_9431/m.38180 type:complete len:224 (+) Transcript_9431:642-1313(+)
MGPRGDTPAATTSRRPRGLDEGRTTSRPAAEPGGTTNRSTSSRRRRRGVPGFQTRGSRGNRRPALSARRARRRRRSRRSAATRRASARPAIPSSGVRVDIASIAATATTGFDPATSPPRGGLPGEDPEARRFRSRRRSARPLASSSSIDRRIRWRSSPAACAGSNRTSGRSPRTGSGRSPSGARCDGCFTRLPIGAFDCSRAISSPCFPASTRRPSGARRWRS